ncbi:hypothetical protein [Nocardia pneumoniae]|uniref:hypothetical protein n=1 Tax=Nocardia pneumoniae TaxID=228601 RepID=UPI001FDEEB57|nr:hypothetical protein [Nocardia pneumoniae]
MRLAIETVGGLGYSRTCDLEMRYRDVHGCLFHPLPRAEQTRFSGRVLLGHSPIGRRVHTIVITRCGRVSLPGAGAGFQAE